jgi:hypothetical protein
MVYNLHSSHIQIIIFISFFYSALFDTQAEEICKLCNLVFVNEVSCELHKGGQDHRAVSQAGAAGPQCVVLLQVQTSAGDPDPQHPHVFGLSGSRSISQRLWILPFSVIMHPESH